MEQPASANIKISTPSAQTSYIPVSVTMLEHPPTVPVPVNPVNPVPDPDEPPYQGFPGRGHYQLPEPPMSANLASIFKNMESIQKYGAESVTDNNKPKTPNVADDDNDEEKCVSDEDFQKEVEKSAEVKKIVEEIINKIPKDACGVHPPQHRKEVVKVNSKCPPRVATIRRRLPSPEPDIVERVTMVKPPQDCINIIIEKPSMPGPCCIDRIEHEPPQRPNIRHNVVCVPPSSKCPPGTKAYTPLPQNYASTIANTPYTYAKPTNTSTATPITYRSSITTPVTSSFQYEPLPLSAYTWHVNPQTTSYDDSSTPVTIRISQTPNTDSFSTTEQMSYSEQSFSWPETTNFKNA